MASPTASSWQQGMRTGDRASAVWTLHDFAALGGRILLSQIFLMAGLMKIPTWSETAAHMAAEGMVLVPLFLFGAIVFEVGGGLSILLGYRARLGALALIVFLIPATLIFHDFWTYEDPARVNQMQHFMKNVALMGGLLMIAATGPGRISIDARTEK